MCVFINFQKYLFNHMHPMLMSVNDRAEQKKEDSIQFNLEKNNENKLYTN